MGTTRSAAEPPAFDAPVRMQFWPGGDATNQNKIDAQQVPLNCGMRILDNGLNVVARSVILLHKKVTCWFVGFTVYYCWVRLPRSGAVGSN